jgi:hypothetical protein
MTDLFIYSPLNIYKNLIITILKISLVILCFLFLLYNILLNGDDVEFKPLDESDPIFAEIGFDISSQSGEDFVDSLSSQDVDNVYDILKTAGHLFKENFSYDIQDSSVGKNLDITDIIKKPTGNDLIQIKFKDHELRLTRIEAQELIDLLLKRLK